MKRRKPETPQRPLIAPRPTFDLRQRQAMAYVRQSGFWSGKRMWDATADVLLLRMGLQLHHRMSRWGYQTSNPGYHEVLMRCPALDNAEPGPAWLRDVYSTHPLRMPLTLSSSRAALAAKGRPAGYGVRSVEPVDEVRRPVAVPAQPDLFAAYLAVA